MDQGVIAFFEMITQLHAVVNKNLQRGCELTESRH